MLLRHELHFKNTYVRHCFGSPSDIIANVYSKRDHCKWTRVIQFFGESNVKFVCCRYALDEDISASIKVISLTDPHCE